MPSEKLPYLRRARRQIAMKGKPVFNERNTSKLLNLIRVDKSKINLDYMLMILDEININFEIHDADKRGDFDGKLPHNLDFKQF